MVILWKKGAVMKLSEIIAAWENGCEILLRGTSIGCTGEFYWLEPENAEDICQIYRLLGPDSIKVSPKPEPVDVHTLGVK